MLASQIRTVAFMLRRDPTISVQIVLTAAARLDELADCVQALENAPIPVNILAAAGVVPVGENVVRLADVRVVRS